MARGESLAGVAHRIGVREELLQAIEDGRFADLPRGIYARAAIRSFATAVGCDPAQVLEECHALLPDVDDPIDALARLRGIRSARKPEASVDSAPVHTVQSSDSPAMWKPLAAAAIDSAIVMAMMLLLVAVTAIFCAAPPSAFRGAPVPGFVVVGILLASCYFVCFAGIARTTLGERAMRLSPAPGDRVSHDLNAVLIRTVRGGLRDVSAIRTLGDALGRAANDWHTRMQSPSTTA